AEGLDLGGVDLGHRFDRPRQLEVRARLQDARELAEAQHHATLLFADQLEAGEHHQQRHRHQHPAPDTAVKQVAQRSGQTAAAPASAIAAAWLAVALRAVSAIAAGYVPGHACSISQGRRRTVRNYQPSKSNPDSNKAGP